MARRSQHVVCDKRFTLTLAQARDPASASASKLLSVFHNRRCDSDFLAIRSATAILNLISIVFASCAGIVGENMQAPVLAYGLILSLIWWIKR